MDAQFLKACETGNLNEVLNILYYHDGGPIKLLKTDPNTLEHMHYFHAVCLNGHCDIVEQLFYFDVDVNLDSAYGTPLAVACQGGHLRTVKTLVKHGAKIYDRDANPTLTPFFLACKHGHLEILTYLIEQEPGALLELGSRLLVEACREGFLDIVVLLVSKKIDIDGGVHASTPTSGLISFDSLLEIPLQAACSQNQVEVVEYLLQERVEVSISMVQNNYQVLGEAVRRNFKEHLGKFRKLQAGKSLLEGDFSVANFYDVHKSWFTDYAEQLVSLDLSNNNLHNIPKEILNLPAIREINLSANNLLRLPEVENVEDSRLEEIIASSNKLKHVPLSFFNIKGLCHLNLVNNEMVSLVRGDNTKKFDMDDIVNDDDVSWQCHSLRCLNLARNQLKSIPSAIHAANSLEKLQLCGNKLTSFPKGWKCPLRILNLSQNELTDFKESMFNTWTQTLVDLNLSSNKLTTISWDICQLQMLQSLNLSHNAIESMPPKNYWNCSNLRKLNLASNQLFGVSFRVETLTPSRISRRFTVGRSPTEERIEIEDEFPSEVFGATLECLDLSDNKLSLVPSSICQLTSLEELNLAGNRHLKTLPPELGNLTECYQLGLEGLHLTGIPKYARSGRQTTSKDVLTYLRAKQRKAVSYNRMKLMVIGLQGRGKTTLLAALRNRPLPPNISTVGIVVNEWTVSSSQSLFEKVALIGKKEQSNPSITFSTWDLAGQQIYYSTHQCFLSSNTLYLAVWNVSHGDEGIDKLKPWLLNVQARAPGSHVIIVGTHTDLLPDSGKAKRIDELRLNIAKRYDKKGFPIIKGYFMVSCTTGENMAELRQAIYQTALKLKETESAGKGESLIGRKIPLSYLKLQENVVKEAEKRKRENKPPILNEEQMLELAKQDPNNDIVERDELVLAARFLHENGVILHYNDRSRGLDKLYFIEPGWLCEIMALLVTVKETNAFVKGGIIERSKVDLLLRNPRLPPQFMDQYIQLMERFEVALTLDESRLLVPSMLPRDKPGLQLADLSKLFGSGSGRLSVVSEGTRSRRQNEDPTSNHPFEYLRRLYKMNYVPSGFWSRLIARLMIAVQRWGTQEGLGDELICNEEGKSVRTTSNFRPVPHGYSMIYWRQGMGVVYDGGHLLVESYTEMERNEHTGILENIEGVMVTVWSAEQDFSVLGFVTDQINSLISEWYPGLEESDKHGIPLVRQVIPCPICAVNNGPSFRLRRSLSMRNVSEMEECKPTEFSLLECAAAAVDYTEIACPQHVDTPVKLASLVPDLVLSDLPPELMIDRKVFVFNPSEENRLGSGGAGEVFLGMYRKEKVAVKRFYSSKAAGTDSSLGPSFGRPGNRGGSRHTDGGYCSARNRSHVFTVSPTTIEEDLRRTKILTSFWELRQEVSVLGRLTHPCVVALVGVSIQPLCIVLELSPLGSLYSILEKEMAKLESVKFQQNTQQANDVRKPIFDRDLTYKIVYQVAHALHYLHNIGIIYRDLKSDNLLVWSLDKDALVHVKLSDYGISRFATPQGMLGEEGTPGFQAPEVRTGSTYNEKVDIFSFAMLIYEILSGLRPFHECRCSAQIKKALRRGERPSLQRSYVDSELPELEALMTRCWKELATSRPSSEGVLDLMEDPSFLCLNRAMPYVDQEIWNSITAFIPLSSEDQVLNEAQQAKGSHSVMLWGGDDEERFYSVVDCKTGVDQVPQTLCLGPRVACLARVGDRYWLGTEGSVIEVFGRPELGSDLKVLWSIKLNGHVLAMEVEHFVHRASFNSSIDRVRRIFACLTNGSVIVISRSELRQPSSSSCNLQFKADANEKIRQEASVFSVMTTIQVDEPGSSACSLLFVNDGRELWVGCGNNIAIIDVDTLEVVDKFRAYVSSRSNVRSMVSNGPTVFTINRKTPAVFQWSVESRQCICKFHIDQENPRGLNVAREVTPKNEDDVTSGDDDVARKTSDITLEPQEKFDSKNLADESEQVVDNASDSQLYIDVHEHPVNRFQRQPSLMRTFKRSSSRNSSRKRRVVKDSVPDPNDSVQKMRSRTQVMNNTERRVTCALIVDENLWLGRETGDIVVVDISGKPGGENYGRVHAVLTMGTERGHLNKGVHSMLRVGGDKVASCCRVLRERGPIRERPRTTPAYKRSFVTMKSPIHQFLRSHPLTMATHSVAMATPPKEECEAKSEKFQLCVWERWNSDDFKQFHKYHESLEKAS